MLSLSATPTGVLKPGLQGTPLCLPETQLFLLSHGTMPRSPQGAPAVPAAVPTAVPALPLRPLLPSTVPPFLEEEVEVWRGRATGPGPSQEGGPPSLYPGPPASLPHSLWEGLPLQRGAPCCAGEV